MCAYEREGWREGACVIEREAGKESVFVERGRRESVYVRKREGGRESVCV